MLRREGFTASVHGGWIDAQFGTKQHKVSRFLFENAGPTIRVAGYKWPIIGLKSLSNNWWAVFTIVDVEGKMTPTMALMAIGKAWDGRRRFGGTLKTIAVFHDLPILSTEGAMPSQINMVGARSFGKDCIAKSMVTFDEVDEVVQPTSPATSPVTSPAPKPTPRHALPVNKARDFWRNNGGFKTSEDVSKNLLTVSKGDTVWEFSQHLFPEFNTRVPYGEKGGVRPIKHMFGAWWAVAAVKDGEPIIGLAAVVDNGSGKAVYGDGGVIKRPGYMDIHWMGGNSPHGKAIDAFLNFRKGHIRVTKVEPKVDAAPAPVPMPASAPIPEPEPVPVPFPDPKIEIPCVAADLSRLLGNDDNAALIEAINKLTAEVARLNAKLARLAD
jgi:hypothetical protein